MDKRNLTAVTDDVAAACKLKRTKKPCAGDAEEEKQDEYDNKNYLFER